MPIDVRSRDITTEITERRRQAVIARRGRRVVAGQNRRAGWKRKPR